MKTRVHAFQENGFYCLTGNSSANSLFFEDTRDQKLFFKLIERFLGEMITIHFYSTNKTGWTLCFTTKKASDIRHAFFELKKKARKNLKAYRDVKVSNMLSEHFRFFLSCYVKRSNFRHGRHGVRVHSNMEKYIFETMEDFEAEIGRMKALAETKVQKSKYRPYKGYYLVDKELSRMSTWRHSFVGLNGEKQVLAVLPSFRKIVEKSQLLRELIIYTYHLHFGPNTNPFPPPNLG